MRDSIDASMEGDDDRCGWADSPRVPRPHAAAPVPGAREARWSSGRRTALWSACSGFFLGIIFWHAVGFWTFVGSVVLRGSETARERPRLERYVLVEREREPAVGSRSAPTWSPPVPEGTWPGQTGSLSVSPSLSMRSFEPGACTELGLDRMSGRTVPAACDDRAILDGHGRLAVKTDRRSGPSPANEVEKA